MINLALIGAGAHSLNSHAPALQRYAAEHPGAVTLAAVCDRDLDRARQAARAFGFRFAVGSIDALFAPGAEPPDALVAVLPIAAMVAVTPALFARGLPLLIEKPLGTNLHNAERLVAAARQAGAVERVMVSFNRRYDPALCRAIAWLAGRPPCRYVRATMVRTQRTESDFVWGTGIHLIDALAHLAGPLTVCPGGIVCPGREPPDAARLVQFTGRHGAAVILEVLPTAGAGEESIRIAGDEYLVDISTGAAPPWRVRAVRNLTVDLDLHGAADEPGFVSNGTDAETAAFLDALVAGRPLPAPSLDDALASSQLADRIQAML